MSLTANSTRSSFNIRLDQFEGPLDLLLYLIQSHELDISKVSISKITNQYLVLIRKMQEMNFDVASDYLVMAATLIMWKSKALLPKEEDPNAAQSQDDLPLTQEELVRRLQERKRFLEAAEKIEKMPLLGDDVFTRPTKRPPVEKIWKEMNVTQMATTYQDIRMREERRKRVIMKKETVSLADKIREFGARLTPHQMTALESMVADRELRGEWVVAFLASLELSRLKKLKIYQEATFDPIFIELMEALDQFDPRQASGFDYVRTGEIKT